MAGVDVVFADLDGTLVHYAPAFSAVADVVAEDEHSATATVRYRSGEVRECVVLSSLTGGKAYLSKTTVALVRRLRALGVCFCIVSGARSSTYLGRRPRLPDADYEFFENGGRMLAKGRVDAAWTDRFEAQVGPLAHKGDIMPVLPPLPERAGSLWELHRALVADGWAVDARDYTTNIRIDVARSEGKSAAHFERDVRPLLAARGLAATYNLGKADVYPAASGKANAARHVLRLNGWAAEDAVAMFDDDNDLELGALVGRSFLPGVTHPNVLEAMKSQPSWTLTEQRAFLGTEEALRAIIALREESSAARSAAQETSEAKHI